MIFSIVILLIFLTSGCQRQQDQPSLPPKDECDRTFDIPTRCPGLCFEGDSIGPGSPLINPENPYEFIFRESYSNALLKFNMLTRQLDTILDMSWIIVNSNFCWTDEDYIFYVSGDAIFRMRSNGSEHTNLGNYPFGTNRFLRVLPDGKRIYIGDRIVGVDTSYLVIDLAGKLWDVPLIDSNVENHFYPSYVSRRYKEIFVGYGSTVEVFDVTIRKSSLMNKKESEIGSTFIGYNWSVEGNKVYFSSANADTYGIYHYDINTGHLRIVKGGCRARHYGNLCVSPDGVHLIAERYTFEQRGPKDVYQHKDLVMMKLDGSEERVIAYRQ